jgi:MFS transporter, ACS family, D-galactonate transporter
VVEQTLQDPETSPAPPAGSRPPAADGPAVTPASGAARGGKPTRTRWVIAGFCFAGLAINYIDRSAVSVALPFMTDDLSLSPTEQGLILSAFSWTYSVMQLPSGWLIDKLGARVMFGASVLLWSLFTGLTAIAGSFASLLSFRLGLGIGEAGAYPSSAKAVSQWFPQRERGRATAFYDSGARVGSALAVPIVAALIGLFGWRSVFVIMGVLGLLWVIGWWAYFRAPEAHRGVNEAELALITSQDEPVQHEGPAGAGEKQGGIRDLLRYRTVWGMIAGFSCLNFVVTFFLTWFPSYLVEERGFDLLKLGFFGVIPGLTAIVGSWAGGLVGDALLARGWTVTRTRKTCLVAGMMGSSVIALAVVTEQAWLALVLLSLSYFSIAFAIVSVWCLPADVAPKHLVGTLGGAQNFVANIASAASPIVIGALAGATGSFVVPLVVTGGVAVLGAASFGLLIRRVEPIQV